MSVPPIPTPPTDNLYKFMALSGVVLLIAAPFFWANFYISQAERNQMAIETVIETFPTLDFYISAVENKIGATVSEEHKKLVEKYETRQMESRRALSQLLVYESFRRVVTVASIVLSVLGCGLAILGFRWWYIRVQKPLDQILKKQAEKNEDSA